MGANKSWATPEGYWRARELCLQANPSREVEERSDDDVLESEEEEDTPLTVLEDEMKAEVLDTGLIELLCQQHEGDR